MRWLALIAVIGGVVAALVARSRHGRTKPEVGAVSDQWIAEHQVDQPTT
jgi:hypothetical protein